MEGALGSRAGLEYFGDKQAAAALRFINGLGGLASFLARAAQIVGLG